MIHLLLSIQLAADSTYSSDSVRALVAAAAARNAAMSALLPAYRARATSEFTWTFEDSAARPQSMLAQQHYSAVRWSRGAFDVKVLYERPAAQLPNVQSWMGPGWLIPALYGDGFAFVYPQFVTDQHGQRQLDIDTVAVPHPLGPGRVGRYRYSGGTHEATLHVGNREIPIVRIHVVPVLAANANVTGFEGDLYLEANHLDVVRARGRLVIALNGPRHGERFKHLTGSTIASYIDVTNEEIDGRFWLPQKERIEFQMTTGLMLGSKSVMRLSATFDDHAVDSVASGADASTINPRARVSFASYDSLRRKRDWADRPGASSVGAHSSDFDDVAPTEWRADGPARFTLLPSQMSRVIRVNPVEGWFTGLEGTLALRDAAPGLSARAFGGWAWSEETARGGVGLDWIRDGRGLSLHAERSLESTNDFESPVRGGDQIFATLLGFSQRRDWLDRRSVSLAAFAHRGLPADGIASLQIGVARDESEVTRLLRMPFAPRGESLPPNRAARAGSYRRARMDLELRPAVGSFTPVSGFGAALHYEFAGGGLAWQRVSGGVIRRDQLDDIWFVERLDAGIVGGASIPPQQLFELGGPQDLAGYLYKQFAGDRAAIGSAGASYLFPATRGWRVPASPRWLPAIAPGLSAGAQFGWTSLSSGAASSVLELDPARSSMPISVATDGVRGSAGAGFSFFSGLVHLGAAHAFDRGASWRWVAGFGTRY
jgi:hypothetical protein